MPSHQSADVVVIGAGAVGCALALRLVNSGLSTIVIERDGVACNASGYAWGGLSAHFGSGVPGPMTEHYRKAIAKHINLYDEWGSVDTHDWALQKVTSISLAANEETANRLKLEVEWMQKNKFEAQMIGPDEIYALEPAISSGMVAASVVSAGWELDSYRYTTSLASQAEIRGANFIQADVKTLKTQRSNATGVNLADDTQIDASVVIAATGPWSNEIEGIPELPVKPTKGEILRLERPGNDLQNRVGFNGFNVGRKPDGTVWAGTYEWNRGFNRDITEEGRRHIRNGVTQYLPSLAESPIVRSTACLRPVASDGFPIVGESNVVKGLYHANGAGKKGILLSPLIADWIAELIIDEVKPPDPVSSARFASI